MDAAILETATPIDSTRAKVDEIPFDFERRRLSVVVTTEDPRQQLLITKGAPESVLEVCDAVEIDGRVAALDAAAGRRASRRTAI